jgi:CheY-like chemotaxis protein
VVAVTAFDNEENIKNCYNVGMVEVLQKPVVIDELK